MACLTGNKNVIIFAPTRCLTLNKGVTIIIKKIVNITLVLIIMFTALFHSKLGFSLIKKLTDSPD